MRIQKTDTPAKTAPARQAPVEKKAPDPLAHFDDVFRKRTPEEVRQAKAVIAEAAKSVGDIPLKNSAKQAYIENAAAELKKADAALDTLQRARFDGVLPEAEEKALAEQVGAIGEKLAKAKARLAGEPAIGRPLNPFRPLGQAARDLAGQGGIIGGLLAPLGVIIDVVDTVTRPIQAVYWPLGMVGHYGEKAGRAIGKLGGIG